MDKLQTNAPSRADSRRTRKAIELLREHSWLLPQEGWVQLQSRAGDALALAEREGLLRAGSAWGIDDNEVWIERARSRHPRLARWIQSNPKEAPLPDGQAGVVMLLSQTSNLSAALREMSRIARENALVILALPASEDDGGIYRSLRKVHAGNTDWQAMDLPEDPLQRWKLREIIERGNHFNLQAFWAATLYEPAGYSSAHSRLEEIEDEGREEWLRAFRDDHQIDAWQEVREDWLQSHKPQTHRHHGFSSYVLFRAL